MKASLQDGQFLIVIAPRDFRDEEPLQPKGVFEAEGAVVEVASTTTDPARGMLGAEIRLIAMGRTRTSAAATRR